MRIPFDLIAAVLAVEEVRQYLLSAREASAVFAPPASCVAAAWGSFLLSVWLLNELVTRQIEWRTRFGRLPAGQGGIHPLIIHTWAIRVAQALTVGFYALTLWELAWPVWVRQWPLWLGLGSKSHIGNLLLADSDVAAIFLALFPFLLAMLLAWIPQCRLASRLRGRPIALLDFLGNEARLAWVPLVLWLLFAAATDVWNMLPKGQTDWLNVPGAGLLSALLPLLFLYLIGLPLFIVWWWRCTPLPEGPLKASLLELMQRSGVKARGIFVWGPRGSGFLNACVLGPWAPFRYVLISPQLADELSLDETEAVLAHELGHARYGHLSLLLFMMLIMTLLLKPLTDNITSPLAQSCALSAFVILYIWGFFGTVMRQCEREADLASAELLGTPRPLIMALEKLAHLGGNIRNVFSWHHGSIASRVAAMEKLSADPELSRAFHARLRLIKLVLTLLTAAGIGAQLFFELRN